MKEILYNILKEYQFATFATLTILISWFPWFTTGKGFFVFGPSVAGVIIIALTQGKDGLKILSKRALYWKVKLKWWLIALFLSGFIIFISLPINKFFGGVMPTFAMFKHEWFLIPVYFLLTLIGGPLGEEFGWRGFALPYLQNKISPIGASLLIGLLWGLWHIPLFFQQGSVHAMLGLSLLPIFIIGEIALSVIMTWVYNNTGSSLLIAGIILHNADNFWTSTLFINETMTSAFGGGMQSTLNISLYLISTFMITLLAFIIAFISKGKLGLQTE